MQLVLFLILIVGFLIVFRIYKTEDGRIPPADTSRGKQARVFISILLFLNLATIIYDIKSGTNSAGYWLRMFLISSIVPGIRLLRDIDKDR
jgi:hypothetical protein